MKKHEAIEAMKEGKKVRHRYFDDKEWVMMDGAKYLFEDGIRCDPDKDFWRFRTGPEWNTDWEIFEPVNSSMSEKEEKPLIKGLFGGDNLHCRPEDIAKSEENEQRNNPDERPLAVDSEIKTELRKTVKQMYDNVPSVQSNAYNLWLEIRGRLERLSEL